MSRNGPVSGATIQAQLLHPGQVPHAIKLWDTSAGPVQNDRDDKLGNLAGQLGAVIGLFDDETGDSILLDGHHGYPFTSLLPFEPDNWTPRLHTAGGIGKDNVWALRLIADHTNDSQSRAHRSTMFIDEESAQEWGWAQDLFRIVEKNTAVDDAELHYTMAGFLEAFTGAVDPKGGSNQLPQQSGKGTRGAVALEVSRNLGYVCDQKNIGQLSHALVFLKPPPPANPDVPTPEDHNHDPNRPDVPTVDPRFESINDHAPVGEDPSNDPDFQGAHHTPPEANPLARAAAEAARAAAEAGLDEDPGPAPAPQTGNRPKTENELGLRLDVGFLCDKTGKVARFTDEQPPADAGKGDGDVTLVTIFVLDTEAAPDDKLDTLEDDTSNHEKLGKPVQKKKFAGWVKVPKPGDGDCHHYDYSWHEPPPGGSSGSGSSSGSDVATPGGSGTGTGTPGGGDMDGGNGPSGGNDVPTLDDRYQNPDGSPIPDDEPSEWHNQASMQAQHGWAPPHSPGFLVRGNILPSDFGDGWNPVGTMVKTKAPGRPDIRVRLICSLTEELAVDEVIELNVIVIPYGIDGGGPQHFYRQGYVFREGVGFEADPAQYVLEFKFKGFDPDEQVLSVLIERRNDTEYGTNSDAELCIIRTSMISEYSI